MWAVVAGLALIAALGGFRDRSPRTVVVKGERVFLIDMPPCRDHSSCALGVRFGGRFYSLLPTVGVKPEFTTGRLLAVGRGGVVVDEAREVAGYESAHAQVVAMHTDSGWRMGQWDESPFDQELSRRACAEITVTGACS